jgi:hypothetical protein
MPSTPSHEAHTLQYLMQCLLSSPRMSPHLHTADPAGAVQPTLTHFGRNVCACWCCHTCTQLTALVLFKLMNSLPDMWQQLRAGYLVGDTEAGGGTAELGMSHSVSWNICVHVQGLHAVAPYIHGLHASCVAHNT